ncbi:MAG: hypothetical protein ABSE00_02825 [Chitinispirillaceae bacterium]|jgi:hypothetical protein
MIKDIIEELTRIKSIPWADFLTENEHKSDREWWVLGQAVNLLKLAGEKYPIKAEPRNPPDADFHCFNNDESFCCSVEIAEVLTPERKRGEDVKNKARPSNYYEPRPNIWQSFNDVLKKKLEKQYGSKCWLVIYHNIPFTQICNYGTWDWAIKNNVQNLIDEKTMNLPNSPYDQILIINADAEVLVRIHPDLVILIPEKIF